MTTEKITGFCEDNGFTELRPSSTHNCGVPGNWACRLDTNRKLVDGYHAVFVFPDHVALMSLRYPTNNHDWQTHEKRQYETTDELLAALRDLTTAPQAQCWA